MKSLHLSPLFSVILFQMTGTVAFVVMVASFATAFVASAQRVVTTPDAESFEDDILAFEAADRQNPPLEGAILFVGDSTFTRWSIEKDLPEYSVINRGFGGSEMSDLLAYFDRLVVPYKPRLIVVQEGGNDLHDGRSPEQLLADVKAFVERVRRALPDVPIVIGSINASPDRMCRTKSHS